MAKYILKPYLYFPTLQNIRQKFARTIYSGFKTAYLLSSLHGPGHFPTNFPIKLSLGTCCHFVAKFDGEN
jgi:hypothetical protein